MSSNVGFATLSVIPSFDGFQGRLEKGTGGAIDTVGRRSGTRFGSGLGKSAGSAFGKTFRTAAKVGIAGALAVTAGAIKLGVDALGEAREAQAVQRQTNAVLKSTGRVAKVSSRDVGKLAGRLSYMAGVDDELVQSGENVLLTFKDVRNEAGKGNKIFDRATKVALNMSTALGTDLKGANIQLGKALNDPIKGTAALARVGVTFTEQQKEQIKTLVESGDKLAAQKLILKELGSEFGGSARSQASAADRLKVAFGNVEEKLGKGLLPIVQDFQRFLLRKGIPILNDFADWFKKDGQRAIGDFIDKAKPIVNKWLPKIGDGFQTAGGYAKDAAGFAGDMLDAFDKMPGWVKKVLVGGAVGGFAAKKLGLFSLLGSRKGGLGGGSGLLGLVSSTKPVPVLVVNKGFDGGIGGGKKGWLSTALGWAGGALGGGRALGALPRFAPAIPVGLGSAPGQDSVMRQIFGKGLKGSDDAKLVVRSEAAFRALQGGWDETRNRANDYFTLIEQHKNVQLRTTVTGWDLATRDAREYYAMLLQIRDTHVTSGFSGDGLTSLGNAPNQTPPGMTPTSRGVNVNIGTVNVNDPKGLGKYATNRSQMAAMGGFGG